MICRIKHTFRYVLTSGMLVTSLISFAQDTINISNNLEPFIDQHLIESAENVTHQLNHPQPREIAITFDKPWEGRYCGYVTVLEDDGHYRLYYRGLPNAGKDGSNAEVTCVAESTDGVTFTRPNLGLFDADGNKSNNIVLADAAPFSHNFAPFLDTRPGCPAEERYKAIAGTSGSGLHGFISADGFKWTKLKGPLIEHEGEAFSFDSQNNAFWSEYEQSYLCYFRTWRNGYRWISRRTSNDFRNWGPMQDMNYGATQPEHLYTNQTSPYARAPHIYIALAARFMPGRRVVSTTQAEAIGGEANYSGDCSDTVFMSSRGGNRYDRTFMEGFIRPGVGLNNWTSRTNYPAQGIIQTSSDTMSMYVQRNYGQDTHNLQRLALRTDGFASMNAAYTGGEFVTKPLEFDGNYLSINFSTSAAGSIWVEHTNPKRRPHRRIPTRPVRRNNRRRNKTHRHLGRQCKCYVTQRKARKNPIQNERRGPICNKVPRGVVGKLTKDADHCRRQARLFFAYFLFLQKESRGLQKFNAFSAKMIQITNQFRGLIMKIASKVRMRIVNAITLLTLALWSTAFTSAAEPAEGFDSLFNGVDLEGWYGNDPHQTNKATEEKRDESIAAQQEAFLAHWRAENGELINDGNGPYCTTEKEYGDIEFHIDYKTVAKADSGIYLRGTPQVQIWDTTEEGGKWDIDADKGSGGLWNNSQGTPGRLPKVLADKPFGEWNTFRITQLGSRTSIIYNDQLVVDNAIMENYWDSKRLIPLPARGPIHLQTHGGEIRWRNIYIREIPAEEANATLRGDDKVHGFTTIFNGKDLTGWTGATDNYEIRDGAIVCKKDHGGNLFTEAEYSDFIVRLEFKLPPGGNNGLAIRYPGTGNPAYDGMTELQVLDDTADKYKTLDPRQYHGSVYGTVAAHRGYLRPVGQWNYQEVTVKGSTIKVELNGTVIVNADISEITDFMADSPHPGKDRKKGHFGFAGHNDPVMFKNIAIKELSK